MLPEIALPDNFQFSVLRCPEVCGSDSAPIAHVADKGADDPTAATNRIVANGFAMPNRFVAVWQGDM